MVKPCSRTPDPNTIFPPARALRVALRVNSYPDWVSGTVGGGTPISAKSDTPRQVFGLLDRLQGAHTPVAFLGELTPQSEGGTDHVTDTTTWAYGRFVSNASIDVVLGDEGDDEVHKLNKITLEEEV